MYIGELFCLNEISMCNTFLISMRHVSLFALNACDISCFSPVQTMPQLDRGGDISCINAAPYLTD